MMVGSPTFSVLIPSRNRLALLSAAVESVLCQNTGSFEIIISDNASTEDYLSYVCSLGDDRVRLLRSDVPMSVTANWNCALGAARGAYVIMLGDDDALVPGFFEHFDALLDHFGDAEAIYSPAYHYAYPGVVPERPDGYLLRVDNSVLFRTGRSRYWLDPAEARRLGAKCLSFYHDVSFNAQHFVYSRNWILSRSTNNKFYKTKLS